MRPRPARGRRRPAPPCARRGRRRGRRPGSVLAHGSPVVSSTGSASRSARSATSGPSSPSSAISPVPPVRVTRQPASATCAAASSVVRLLAPRELGVGVQVAAEVDQLVGVLVDDGVDDARGVGHGLGVSRPGWVGWTCQEHEVSSGGSARARPVGVVRRQDPVGGHAGAAARRRARRRVPRRGAARTPGERRSRWASSSRTSAQVKSSCCSARLAASPSAPRCSRWREHLAPTPRAPRCPSSPEQVSTGGTQPTRRRRRCTSRSAPASSRAADRASCSRSLAAVVRLVDRDDVGDLEDPLLDALQLVAGAGQGEEQERVDHPGHGRSPTGRRRRSRRARRRTPPPPAPASPGWSRGRRRRGCRRWARAGCRPRGRPTAAASGSCRRARTRRCAREEGSTASTPTRWPCAGQVGAERLDERRLADARHAGDADARRGRHGVEPR